MQLQNYIRILLRRGWIMVLLAVIIAVAAFVFSEIVKQRAPVYQSTIKIQVQPARTDLGQAQAAKQLLGSYEEWLRSTYRARDVIDELQLDMTPRELLDKDVRVSSDLNTLVITIEVENSNGDVANDIARTWAGLFVQWRDQQNQQVRLEDRIGTEILDDPTYVLASPKVTINTIAGGIFGFLIGLGIVFGMEYVESGIIRTSEDVDHFLELPVLGAIPPVEQS